MRLDRLISKLTARSRNAARQLISSGRVEVDGIVALAPSHAIDKFSQITVDGAWLQGRSRHYLMVNKPVGYLSATRDPVHPTVMELVPTELRPLLHIAGRLDRASTGLIILTSDGLWSRRLTEPCERKPKVYRVRTEEPVSPHASDAFAGGIHLAREDLTTTPAQIQLLGTHEARVTIYEGRHHQLKRMFAAVGNRVTSLHRECMDQLRLDQNLAPGAWRYLTAQEVASV